MGFSLFGKDKQSASGTDADEQEGKAASRRRRKSAEEPVDPILPEKKRARRRLVGAAAMVLAAIIGLPMLMESEPQPLSDDVQIHIPSAGKPVADVPMLSPPPAASVPGAEQVSAATAIPEESAAKGQADSDASASAASAAAPRVAEAGKTATSKPDAAKLTTQQPSTERERIAQVKALLEGQNTSTAAKAKAPAESKAKFVLQVAALASPDKVKELQAKLSKAGVASYTEKVKVSNGDQIRVRVGPFASRDEADKMRAKLSGMGLNGMVVTL